MLTQISWLISNYPETVQERVDSVPFTASVALTLKTHPLLILRKFRGCSTPTVIGCCSPRQAALSQATASPS